MRRWVQSELKISQGDPNIAVGAPAAGKMEVLYTYKVPRQTDVKVRPQDSLSMKLINAGGESLATDTFEMHIEDPNGIRRELIAGTAIYETVKEFQDDTKKYRIGGLFYIPPDFLVKIYVKCVTIVVPASCYFMLSCRRRALVAS